MTDSHVLTASHDPREVLITSSPLEGGGENSAGLLSPCFCGHVQRMHGSRPGLVLPYQRCRAWVLDHQCDCPDFTPEETT